VRGGIPGQSNHLFIWQSGAIHRTGLEAEVGARGSREAPVVCVKCSSGSNYLNAKLTWWEICTRSVIVKLHGRAEAELQWQSNDRKKRCDDEGQRY
jgi:hypothetical protein